MIFKKIYFLNLVLLLQFIFVQNSYSVSPLVYQQEEKNLDLDHDIYILQDPYNTLSFNDVLDIKKFSKLPNGTPNLGISSSFYWLTFELKNESNSNRLMIQIAQPTLDYIDMFYLDDKGKIVKHQSGEYLPFNHRYFEDPHYIFPINIYKGETKQVFFKVQSRENLVVPISVGSPKSVLEFINTKDLINGIYIGIMLVMIFYNLFIYFTVRDQSYLYYVIYIIALILTQATTLGYTFQYLWPENVWLSQNSMFIVPVLVGIAGMAFMADFLRAKEYIPKLLKISYVLYFTYIVSLFLNFLGYYSLAYRGIDVTAMLVSIYLIYAPIRIYKKGYKPAIYFLVAWLVFIIGIVFFVCENFGVLPHNNFTRYTMQAGSALETILLSFALANRINILKMEKEESQRKALEALQENDRILKEQNVVLDQKVKERTVELEKSNEELAVAIRTLKEAQAQLVNSEKMASLGQLTAGVAHEINNPINFVTSSIKPLKRDIQDILSLLNKYDELTEQNLKDKKQEIEKYKEAIDLEYVTEEIGSLLKGIDEGAARTSEIVKGLRTFSRIDESDIKKIDINEGLDSTLILLNSTLRDKIAIEKNYGEIDKVECFGGKINQVFMNILNNAIHAVEKKGNINDDGKICISTFQKEQNVMISIRDNGTGMPENIKSKIFDPFFTTKDVGEGTGLGLSIVYNIIESHKGKIEVESELGKGTEFIITLPTIQYSK